METNNTHPRAKIGDTSFHDKFWKGIKSGKKLKSTKIIRGHGRSMSLRNNKDTTTVASDSLSSKT